MPLDRQFCIARFQRAVAHCAPSRLVAERKADVLGPLAERATYGLALGKAALEMARGFGPVKHGVIASHADDGRSVPPGWHVMIAAHPEPDARSIAAGTAVLDLIAGARRNDLVVALISGGASSLVELPAPGVTLDELCARVRACMASGADIRTINRLRGELSALKGGKLARLCEAPVATLAVSDVYDDDIAVIGSGPTIAHRPGDRAEVIAPMRLFADALLYDGPQGTPPLTGTVTDAAAWLVQQWDRGAGPARFRGASRGAYPHREREGIRVGWGEPTVALPPNHGEGGRAQQLALELAHRLRGRGPLGAFVIGSDGMDGPPPRDRPAPAGAIVDHDSWDRIAGAGIDPLDALIRCAAGPALDAIGALVVTGPTGINYGDVMLIGNLRRA